MSIKKNLPLTKKRKKVYNVNKFVVFLTNLLLRGKKMNIPEILHLARIKKGLSQEELAKKLNVHKQSISRWERGESAPDGYMLIELSKELDIVSELFPKKMEETISNKAIQEIFGRINTIEKRLGIMS